MRTFFHFRFHLNFEWAILSSNETQLHKILLISTFLLLIPNSNVLHEGFCPILQFCRNVLQHNPSSMFRFCQSVLQGSYCCTFMVKLDLEYLEAMHGTSVISFLFWIWFTVTDKKLYYSWHNIFRLVKSTNEYKS